jgi:hypothetical protein
MAVDPVLAYSIQLLEALQEQYPAQGTAPSNFCLRAGESSSVVEDLDPWSGEDLCCAGLGWVRMGLSYPSSNFPAPDEAIKQNGCWPVAWATEIEIGLMRCYHPGGQERMATCPEHTQAAINYATDLCTIKQALQAWERQLQPKGRLYQIQGIGPSGPRANCIQTVGTLLIQTKKCCEELEL